MGTARRRPSSYKEAVELLRTAIGDRKFLYIELGNLCLVPDKYKQLDFANRLTADGYVERWGPGDIPISQHSFQLTRKGLKGFAEPRPIVQPKERNPNFGRSADAAVARVERKARERLARLEAEAVQQHPRPTAESEVRVERGHHSGEAAFWKKFMPGLAAGCWEGRELERTIRRHEAQGFHLEDFDFTTLDLDNLDPGVLPAMDEEEIMRQADELIAFLAEEFGDQPFSGAEAHRRCEAKGKVQFGSHLKVNTLLGNAIGRGLATETGVKRTRQITLAKKVLTKTAGAAEEKPAATPTTTPTAAATPAKPQEKAAAVPVEHAAALADIARLNLELSAAKAEAAALTTKLMALDRTNEELMRERDASNREVLLAKKGNMILKASVENLEAANAGLCDKIARLHLVIRPLQSWVKNLMDV